MHIEGGIGLGRKPNYRFERHERERLKAEKKAKRAAAKAERKAGGSDEESNSELSLPDDTGTSAEEAPE